MPLTFEQYLTEAKSIIGLTDVEAQTCWDKFQTLSAAPDYDRDAVIKAAFVAAGEDAKLLADLGRLLG